MGLGDMYSDTASALGDDLEWYAASYADEDGGTLEAWSQRIIDDGRIIFALLHAARANCDAFENDFEPLINAAVAGDTKPLDEYCATVVTNEHTNPEWPAIARAAVLALATLRRTFDPIRGDLQPLLDAFLTKHQERKQKEYAEFKRDTA